MPSAVVAHGIGINAPKLVIPQSSNADFNPKFMRIDKPVINRGTPETPVQPPPAGPARPFVISIRKDDTMQVQAAPQEPEGTPHDAVSIHIPEPADLKESPLVQSQLRPTLQLQPGKDTLTSEEHLEVLESVTLQHDLKASRSNTDVFPESGRGVSPRVRQKTLSARQPRSLERKDRTRSWSREADEIRQHIEEEMQVYEQRRRGRSPNLIGDLIQSSMKHHQGKGAQPPHVQTADSGHARPRTASLTYFQLQDNVHQRARSTRLLRPNAPLSAGHRGTRAVQEGSKPAGSQGGQQRNVVRMNSAWTQAARKLEPGDRALLRTSTIGHGLQGG